MFMMKEIIITEKELIQAFKLNAKNNLLNKKWQLIASEIGLIVAAFVLKYYVPDISIGMVVLFIFFLPIIINSVLVAGRWELKKQYTRNSYLSMPRTVSWDGEFMYGHTQFLESKFPWANFINIQEDNELILLYEMPNCYTIYPKRAFNNNEEMENFLQIARHGILAKRA